MPKPIKVYLAGPDVFLPNAVEVGRHKKALCEEFGFEGLFPSDNNPGGTRDPAAIFTANCALMMQADVGLFNLTPFRGPSADCGTVFELGFMFAQRKPLFGYSNAAPVYRARVAEVLGPIHESEGRAFDRQNLAVEDFGLADNLMIIRSIEESGGSFVTVEETGPTGLSLPSFAALRASLALLKHRGG